LITPEEMLGVDQNFEPSQSPHIDASKFSAYKGPESFAGKLPAKQPPPPKQEEEDDDKPKFLQGSEGTSWENLSPYVLSDIVEYMGITHDDMMDKMYFAKDVVPVLTSPEPRSQARPGRATYTYEEDEVDDGEFERLINVGLRQLPRKSHQVPENAPPELSDLAESKLITPPIFKGSALAKRQRRYPKGGGLMILVDRSPGLTNLNRGILIRDLDGSIRTASWSERRTILNHKVPENNLVRQVEEELYNYKRDPYKLLRGFPRNRNFDRPQPTTEQSK
jgi:hypothetical protein